jgi:hypothetical protein
VHQHGAAVKRLLPLCLLLAGCSWFSPPPFPSSATQPELCGVLLSGSYEQIRRQLKNEGYFIAGRAIQGQTLRLTFVSSDRAALFPSLELALCQKGNIPLSLLCLGYDQARVLGEARRRLNLQEYNQLPDISAAEVRQKLQSAQKFNPQRVFAFEDLRGGAFSVEEANIYALYLENSAGVQSCDQEEAKRRQEEDALFKNIGEQLAQ